MSASTRRLVIRAALIAGVALLPAMVQAQTRAPGGAPVAAAGEGIKPLAFTERRLPNGLRVYALRDTSTPNVAVQVWYDVGSKDDPKGRSGFAHMFEHLMFKATRNLVPEQMDRLTEDVGGYNNASTNDDYTNYFEVIPANHLERLLFAEADRMASLVVEPQSFASERDVVKEELRQRTLAQPYGKLFSIYYPETAYSVHPYARPGIGSLADLESAKIDDVRAFHATYYRPDNAILVVSGNFDPAQLNRWVEKYFAPIAKPSQPIPRVSVNEPARAKATLRTVYEANTPLPAVLISYHIPADKSPDTPAITVLNAILATGESSRLYETLVYRDQLAQSAATFLDTKQATGNLVAYAILADGKSVAAGEAALKAQIARLRDQPVSADELKEAKNEILTSAIEARETAEGKASTLAAAVLIDGDPSASDRQLAAVQRVTAADVQRVARAFLKDAQSATIRYLPAVAAGEQAKSGDTIAVAPTVRVADLIAPRDVAIVTPASPGQRVQPPAPAAIVKTSLPQPGETRLANGLRVITVERHDLPLVTASLVALGGAATDPAGKAGTSSLAATLLTKGTTTRSATEIARQIEALGGSISSDAGRDGATIDVTVKSDKLSAATAILADVAINPTFREDEVTRARTQAIDGVTLTMKDPARLAAMVANRAVFGSAPYGAPVEGTPASLKAINRAALLESYRQTWRPDGSALVIVGDVTQAAARKLAEQQLGSWKTPQGVQRNVLSTPSVPKPRVIVVDMPDAGQAGVVIARPAIARSDARYYPLSVANTVLGGGFSSRLNQEIRIKRGLAYGAGSSLFAGRMPGSISARTQTKNPSAAEVAALIAQQMTAMGAAVTPDAELETRKAVLIGNFGRTIESTAGLAGIIDGYVLQGVPIGELQLYTGKVDAVDAASVQDVSRTLLSPASASMIVAGDAKQFLGPLRKAYPSLEVIEAGSISLDDASLRNSP